MEVRHRPLLFPFLKILRQSVVRENEMSESLEGLKEKIIESIENEASLRSFFKFLFFGS